MAKSTLCLALAAAGMLALAGCQMHGQTSQQSSGVPECICQSAGVSPMSPLWSSFGAPGGNQYSLNGPETYTGDYFRCTPSQNAIYPAPQICNMGPNSTGSMSSCTR